MFKRLLLYLLTMAVLLAVAISAGQWDKDTALLQEHANQISAYLDAQESDALVWIRNNQALLGTSFNARPDQKWSEALESQSLKDYTILGLSGDSVLLWTNNKILPTAAQLREINGGNQRIVQLPAGFFAVRRLAI